MNDTNTNWQKVVFLMNQENIRDDDIIIIATTKEIIPFIYYFSNVDKAALIDIGIFGRFKNGRWQESFKCKDHYIITIASELHQGEDAYYDSGFGISKIYGSEYVIADFDKKVLQGDILNANKQIWLLVSRWVGDEYFRETMPEKLKKYFRMTLAKEVGSIRVYHFKP